MTLEDGMPTISVNRAVAHYAERLDISPAGIRAFYETIDFPDKPPLEDCHIHLSPLYVAQTKEFVVKAQCVREHRTKVLHGDPLAPKADIYIFLGSHLAQGTIERAGESIGHELVHYAYKRHSKNSVPDLALYKMVFTPVFKLILCIVAALIGVLLWKFVVWLVQPKWPLTILVSSVGLTIMVCFWQLKRIDRRAEAAYDNDEEEKLARRMQKEIDMSVLRFVPREVVPPVFVRRDYIPLYKKTEVGTMEAYRRAALKAPRI